MGNVNVNGGPLEWTAVLDDQGIEASLKQLNDNLEQTARKQMQQADQAAKAQREYAQTIISTGLAFKNLGENVQGQFKTLSSLTTELQKVRDAKNELTQRKDLGIVGSETANNSLAALTAQEQELSRSIEKVSQDMQTSDAIMRAASGSIVQRTVQLQALKQEYQNLSEADRNNASIGGGLLSKIQGIDAELKSVNQSFQAVEKHAVGSINEKTANLSKLKSDYTALAEIDRNSDIGKTMLSNIQRVEKEVEVLNGSFRSVTQNAVGSLNAKVAQVTELKNKFAELSVVERNSDIGKSLAKNIKGLDKEIQNINNEFTATNNLASKAALAIGSYLTLSAGTNFLKDIVRVRGEFQQLEVAFNTILGDKAKADKLMAEVVQLAATTPFNLQDVATGAKQLLAYGFAADKVVGNIRMLGDVAAGVGAPLGDIVYLYGTLQTQGRAYTRDIMQFTSRGIPIIGELAKEFGVTKEKVQELVEAGKVGFPEVEKAFQSLTGSGGIFFNLMDAQSKTLTGQLSNLQDAWSQMLNSFGKSGEGVFSDAIQGATFLVKNYQDVLDILKVLIATYGTYKAAVMISTAVNIVASDVTNGLTIAQSLHTRAVLLGDKAMKLLNRTMLANPYVLVAAGLAAVVSALYLFGKSADESKSKAELLSEAQEKVGNRLAETETKIRPYVERLKEANISESERVDIYNKLAAVDPKIVQGLNAKTLSYDALTKNVNAYLTALRSQIALETNKEALQGSIKQEQTLQQKIDNLQKEIDNIDTQVSNAEKKGTGESQAIRFAKTQKQQFENEIAQTKKALELQKKTSTELGQIQVDSENKKQEVKKRTLKVIDDEIAAEKKLQSENSSNHDEFLDHQKKIDALEEERKKIAGASKKEIADANKLENSTNSILEERKNILQQIAALRRDATQSGLTKEQSELDKINEKYDNMLDKIVEFNSKVDKFNQKNKSNVQKFGLLDLATVNDTRNKEIANTALGKQPVQSFKTELEQQKKIFDDFQDAVKEIGIDKAQEIFGEQTKGFKSFLSFLKSEATKNINLINPEKIRQINEAIVSEEKKNDEDAEKRKIETYKRLFAETATLNLKRLAFEKKYEEDVADLHKNFSGKDLEERLQVLKETKEADLKNLGEVLAAQSAGYRALHKDTVDLAKNRIEQEIKSLQIQLSNPNLDNASIQAIKDAINEWEKLKHAIDGSDDKVNRFVNDANKLAGIFSTVATAVDGVNANLAESLRFVANMVSSIGAARSAWDKFKKERENLKGGTGSILDTVGAAAGVVGAVASVISAVVGIFKKAKEQREENERKIKEFQSGVFNGELEINALYRQRTLEIIRQNELRLEGIKKESAELLKQKNDVQKDFNSVLAELQKEKGFQLTNFAGFQFVAPTLSLVGKSFDELEQLFIKGQLQGKAKELFETLQKLKQEGVDVDKQLKELQRETNEIFTGTTFDSLVDSIADGFAQGKHNAADFAGTFEDLMRKAMISSLKFQFLEPAMKAFFDQFADFSQSGGQLDQSEIDNLRNLFNSTITDFDKKMEQFQQISGINLQSSTANTNSLSGAIKAITEDTAELIAGNMSGLRLTAIQQLDVMRQALTVQQNISNNTALTVVRLDKLLQKFNDYETGAKALKIQ
jgi:DNA repair exonuclease SbcCD ATPase subunit